MVLWPFSSREASTFDVTAAKVDLNGPKVNMAKQSENGGMTKGGGGGGGGGVVVNGSTNKTTTTTDNNATSVPPNSKLDTNQIQVSESGGGATASDLKSETEGQATLAALQQLLEPFKGKTLPTNARTRPEVPQRSETPMTLARIWEYVPFFASQGTSLTKAFVSHHLVGPPKPSWGIELTLFTAFLREAAEYSHLSSLSRLRGLLDLSSFLPVPKDGIVTPISFRVKQRGLTGFLAEADAQEDGKRQITGEWVINKRLWNKMQTEYATDKTVGHDRVILYLHGGAYYMFSAETHRYLTIAVSRYTESRLFVINYRLAPETRFPGQLHDAVSAYMRLIIDLKIPPENIVFAGDSAGGGLCLATLMYLRDEGYPLPTGGILMSPWVDLTMSCESWTTNRAYDYLPEPKVDDHLNPVKCLLGDVGIHKYLTHPYVSPLFGNFDRLPPLLIQAGDAEVLRDEITLLAHKASLAGVPIEHEIFEDCVHVFQAFSFLEASRKALQSQRQFIKYKLPTLTKPKDVDYSDMDREIISDAHKVDQKGNAEPTSLPSSPSAKNLQLPPEDIGRGGGVQDGIRSDRSTGTSQDPAEGGMEEVEEEQEEEEEDSEDSDLSAQDSPSLGYGDQEEDDNALVMGSSSPSKRKPQPRRSSGYGRGRGSYFTPKPPRPQRPLLRAYTSARDLFMSKADSSPKSLGLGSSGGLGGSGGGSHSRTRSSTTSLQLAAWEDPTHWPHARSSSHPDLRALLEAYEQSGPSHKPKVYGLTAAATAASSGRATPERKPEPQDPSHATMGDQQVVGGGSTTAAALYASSTASASATTTSQSQNREKNRRPSFVGESPGFGFI